MLKVVRKPWVGLLALVLGGCPGPTAATGTGPHHGASGGTSGAPVCAPLDAGCSSDQPCCAGLACDPALGTCIAPVLDAGSTACGPSQIGGPCVTAADCVLGLACVGSDGGATTCQVFSAFVGGFDCIGAGQICGSSIVPCCAGDCENGTCTGAWKPCSDEIGFTCSKDTDCCTGSELACIEGICQEVGFTYVGQGCALDSDCMPSDGYLCLSGHCHTRLDLPDGGTLLDAGPGCVSTACEAADSGRPQCVLGSICIQPPGVADGMAISLVADPCYAAGLYCSSPNNLPLGVCIGPQENALCIVGGPACAGLPGSTESHLACVEVESSSEQLFNECQQPCEMPADCLDPFSTCVRTGYSSNETTCDWPELYDDAGMSHIDVCSPLASPCNILGQTGGGTCVVLQVEGNAVVPLCYQGDPAGVVGAACDPYPSTRQGGLCAAGLFCNQNGLCVPACDTAGVGPGCDAGECAPLPAYLGLPGLGLCE